MSSTENIISSIRNAIDNILETLQGGDKIITSDIIDKVVAETKVKISIANGIIPMILQELVENGRGTMERGRTGGFYKGKKVQRIDMRKRCDSCHQVIRTLSSIKDNQDISEEIIKDLQNE